MLFPRTHCIYNQSIKISLEEGLHQTNPGLEYIVLLLTHTFKNVDHGLGMLKFSTVDTLHNFFNCMAMSFLLPEHHALVPADLIGLRFFQSLDVELGHQTLRGLLILEQHCVQIKALVFG